MASERLHVVPHEGGWAVKSENKTSPDSTHSTQREAIDSAREMCKGSEADLVIHRPDGTIRNVYSYNETSTNNGSMYEEETTSAAEQRGERKERERPHLEDLVSVGSRVSWGAVLAGAFVSVAMIVALGVLATAAGLSVRDSLTNRGLFIGAMVCSIVALVASLLLGGFMTSVLTAGENKTEATVYGLVMWGVVFALLTAMTATGANIGYSILPTDSAFRPTLPDETIAKLNLTAEQRQTLREEMQARSPKVSPSEAAWWTFAGVMLSLAAAMTGSWLGAGPTLYLLRRRGERPIVRARPGGVRVGAAG